MHRILRLKLIVIILVLICGCQKKVEIISVGEWLNAVSQQANITNFIQNEPYFLNVDKTSAYFKSVQSLVEYKVLDTSYSVNLKSALTNEFVAYTLANLYGEELNGNNVKDSHKSLYPKHIEKVVALGLMNLDKRQMFNPKKIIDRYYALSLLDKVINYLNNKTFTNDFNYVDWKDDLNIKEEVPIIYDEQSNRAVFSKSSSLKPNDIICFEDENTMQYQKVKDVTENKDNLLVSLKTPEVDELFENIKAYDSFEVDFNNAILKNLEETAIFDDNFDFINLVNNHKNSFTYKDYEVNYYANGGNLNININKKGKDNSIYYVEANLFNVRPSYKWNMEEGKIKEGYFKIDFDTNAAMGIKKESYKKIYGDFSTMDANAFLPSLKNIFKDEKEFVTIPICKVEVLIPNSTIMTLEFLVQIKLYASGRIELSLKNNHSLGMEIRNNNIRVISDHKNDADFIIKSSGYMMLDFIGGLKIANLKLADIGLSGGLKADLKSIVHLYDSQQNMSTTKSDLPTDLLYDLSEGNNDIRICGDLNAYWVLDADLNSSKTLAGKLGLSKKFNIFNKENGSLFPGLNKHIENWQFVEKCTRNSRYNPSKNGESLKTDKIAISDYSIAIKTNETKKIKVISLPDGYSLSDLIFEINNDIAIVDQNGNVTGNKVGSAIVKIKTSDDKHQIKCHIFCKE